MHLSIFTDEVSPNPQRAMALAAAWDIRAVEVRNLPGGRFPRAAEGELAEFGRWVEAAGLRVSGVSPGLFKCALDDPQVREGIDRLLPRSCEWAQRWGHESSFCIWFFEGRRHGARRSRRVLSADGFYCGRARMSVGLRERGRMLGQHGKRGG